MDNPNQPNQQTPAPQYQQNIIIVAKQKSVGVAFILAFFFGPLGLLYASVTGGIVMFILGVIISIVTLGLGLIVVWIACIIWAVVAANNANSKVSAAATVNINPGTMPLQQPVYQAPQPQPIIPPLPPQQPVYQAPQPQPIIQPLPPQQPVQQQAPPSANTSPQYTQDSSPENSLKNGSNDLSLNSFSDWVTNNKKGLIFGLGGVVIILILVVAIKFVVGVDFSKQKQEFIQKSSTVDTTSPGGDANAPTQFVAAGSAPSSNYPGIYPQSSARPLTPNDISSLNKYDLKIMRNEIFARHGYIFKTPEMKSYFATQAWYKPMYNNVDNQLSTIEKANVELIKRYEK